MGSRLDDLWDGLERGPSAVFLGNNLLRFSPLKPPEPGTGQPKVAATMIGGMPQHIFVRWHEQAELSWFELRDEWYAPLD